MDMVTKDNIEITAFTVKVGSHTFSASNYKGEGWRVWNEAGAYLNRGNPIGTLDEVFHELNSIESKEVKALPGNAEIIGDKVS
jgi:hypothetical protein